VRGLPGIAKQIRTKRQANIPITAVYCLQLVRRNPGLRRSIRSTSVENNRQWGGALAARAAPSNHRRNVGNWSVMTEELPL
jgi:hypothetical protein